MEKARSGSGRQPADTSARSQMSNARINFADCGQGKCENCKFMACWYMLQTLSPRERSMLWPSDPNGQIFGRTMFVCITCFETPMGMFSPNLVHERLPDAEYLVK
jgi:hypothetical protein